MKHYITIALCTFLSQMCTAQVMMLFSQDSLTGIVSPLDVDSLFYWFAADVGVTDSLGGAIATDEGVGTWNDLSGNGHHVTQSTNGARPVWKATGGPGSKPTIQFDGTNDFLASAAHWWGSDDLTVFVVYKHNNATLNQQESVIARLRSTDNNRQWRFYGREADSFYRVQFDHYQSGTSAPLYGSIIGTKETTFRLHSIIKAGASNTVTWHKNGSEETVTPNTGASGDGTIYNSSIELSIGCINASTTPALFLQGSISEIIVYSRALSATERTAIENYLNRKYDLYYLIILGFPLASARRRKLIPNEKKNAA